MGRMRGAIVVDTERCKGCGLCVVACPRNILHMSDKAVNRKGYTYVCQDDCSDCNGCTSCAIVCPDGCISVYRVKEPTE